MPFPDQQIGTQGLQSQPGSPPTDNDELTWTFERVSPLTGVPAVSDEWHVYRVCARRATAEALDASEMELSGVEVAYHDGVSILAWYPLQIDTRRNENAATGSEWVYFHLRVGPISGLILPAATYAVTIRAGQAPQVARNLAPLTVLPPNPSTS